MLEAIELKIKKLPHALSIPEYATKGSSGMDLVAAIEKPIILHSMQRYAIPTGLIFEIPEGYEAQIRSRSGLSLKKGICLANGIGTIDSDYRGEVKVILINLDNCLHIINPGDKIAQVVLTKYLKADITISSEISDTLRGDGGFGSTDKTTSVKCEHCNDKGYNLVNGYKNQAKDVVGFIAEKEICMFCIDSKIDFNKLIDIEIIAQSNTHTLYKTGGDLKFLDNDTFKIVSNPNRTSHRGLSVGDFDSPSIKKMFEIVLRKKENKNEK